MHCGREKNVSPYLKEYRNFDRNKLPEKNHFLMTALSKNTAKTYVPFLKANRAYKTENNKYFIVRKLLSNLSQSLHCNETDVDSQTLFYPSHH